MNIGIDMMGGDFAPLEAVRGVSLLLKDNPGKVILTCIGDPLKLQPLLEEYHISEAVKLVKAEQIIGYHEHPTKALKEKKDSSIAIGFRMLAEGSLDAFISAGNTGAMLIGTMFSIGTIKGVIRPTISSVIPKLNGNCGVLLDVGLNADCKPEHLNQFAILGALYAENILGIPSPSTGLINVGEEEGKGNLLALSTYPLLKNNPKIKFIGNVEGRDIFTEKADVMVCDGFTGNIMLKMAESFYAAVRTQHLEDNAFFSRFHYENYGGTLVLGVKKPVVIGHGISNGKAFLNMIRTAQKAIETEMCRKMEESLNAI